MSAELKNDLARTLDMIKLIDLVKDYQARFTLVLRAVSLAHAVGYSAGFHWDDAGGPEVDGYRIVAYIALPTGQVSWHMPEYPDKWDGHTTEQKYERARAYTDSVYRANVLGGPPL